MKNLWQILTFVLMLQSLALLAMSPDSIQKSISHKADFYFNNLRYDSAGYWYLKVLPYYQKQANWEQYCHYANKYAESLLWQDSLLQARIICRLNLQKCILNIGETNNETAAAYRNCGFFGFLSDNQTLIVENYIMAVHILKMNLGYLHPETAKTYELLGTYYESISDTANAKKYLMASYKIWCKTKGPDNPDLGNIYRYLGLFYKRFAKLDSAIFCFKKAKSLFDQKAGEANFQSVKCLNNMAQAYSTHGNDTLTQATYQQCLYLISRLKSPNRFASVMTFFNIADNFEKRDQWEAAIGFVNKALKLYFPDFENENIFSNPASISSHPFYLVKMIMFFKAHWLEKYAESNPLVRKQSLIAAFWCNELAMQINKETLNSMTNFDDILKFENGQASNFYALADRAFGLFNILNDTVWLSRAMGYLSEKSVLENKFGQNIFHSYAQAVSVSFMEERNKLKTEITCLKTELLTHVTHYFSFYAALCVDKLSNSLCAAFKAAW